MTSLLIFECCIAQLSTWPIGNLSLQY